MNSPQEKILKSKLLRQSIAATSGSPATESDIIKYELCRRTMIAHSRLVEIAAESNGRFYTFAENLGFTRNYIAKSDNRYWVTLCGFLRKYIPYYEKEFKKEIANMENTLALPNSEQVQIEIAEKLGVPFEVLELLNQNPQEVDLFLEAQRANVGRLAEIKLFELIAKGDRTTVLWALPKLNPAVYGDNKVVEDKEVTITVSEI